MPDSFSISVSRRKLRNLAFALGATAILAAVSVRTGWAQAVWQKLTGHNVPMTGTEVPATFSKYSEHEQEFIRTRPPQEQAERLLQAAINHDEGATDMIVLLSGQWYGKLRPTEEWKNLDRAAMASNDVRLRAAALETRLAVDNLPKTLETVQRLIQEGEEDHTKRRANAFLLGCLANRGVRPEGIYEWLRTWQRESEPEVRAGVVRGLALLGSDAALQDVEQVVREDTSPKVRSAAMHAIARTGMFTAEQRWAAIPGLLDVADSAEADVRRDLFEALREITAADVADDLSAWREWFTAHPKPPEQTPPES